ncbi:hypothetical protein VCHA34P129_30043 [Vibrio chagasii]|nr:hypothetical protein VCHA34P129_30043 [Vibrio chagasii]CAH7191040.1 hypothetical protein VCHA52P455_20339 [Vibrio chagasii]CAH7438902.1 hypothetical protein VCHA53O464_30001 [Vibrio chagasii]
MIKEVTNSIKAALYQRVSSPLYGTYIFSWFLFNWDIVLPLLFGTADFDARLESFNASLYSAESGFLFATIFYPALMTALILGLQPLLQRYLFIYTEWNKSEGLKKRDKFSSETMLTLEQSNELRASVQKVQQFHQEVLKNKDAEIAEYKKQVELKETSNQKLSAKNLELIEASSASDTTLSEISSKLANSQTQLSELNNKYSRLSKILAKQRGRQHSLRQELTPDGIFANDIFLESIQKLINVDDNFSAKENSNIVEELLAVSSSERWKSTCYKLIIEGFGESWSYNMADTYFEVLIKPYLKNFNDELLNLLLREMNSNNQISDRNKAESDLRLVKAVIAAKAA